MFPKFSHKVNPLQAAVSFQGCCNGFCADVADVVVELHITRHLQTQQSSGRIKPKVDLTRSSRCKLLLTSKAAAIDIAPMS
jgi:hypothetical protein